MAKLGKQDISTNRKDSFFVRAKNNKLKQKSEGPSSSFKKKNYVSTISNKPTHNSDAGSNSTDFFLKKSETKQSGGHLEDTDGNKQKNEKKPFDKKKWRIQKYSKKYKVEQWEEKRKKIVTREYYKQIKHDKPGFDVQKLYEEENSQEVDDASQEEDQDKEKNMKRTQRPHNRYERIHLEQAEKKAASLKRKEERTAALEAYKKKKHEKYKKLSLKNKKGQPIMKHRMEILLEGIQKSCTQ